MEPLPRKKTCKKHKKEKDVLREKFTVFHKLMLETDFSLFWYIKETKPNYL